VSITYTNTRYEPDGRLCHAMEPQQISVGHAVIRLVRYELGYGGSIRELTPTYIKVYTNMMGRYDIVEFEGSEEAMLPLMAAVSAWAYGKEMKGREHIKAVANKCIESNFNRPIQVAMMGMLMFSGWVDPVLCVAAGLDEDESRTLLDHVTREVDRLEALEKVKPGFYRQSRLSIKSDVMDPLIELVIDGGKLADVLELIAA